MLLVQRGRAEEPARKFLDGLRQRGYADVALMYLERMEKSPRAPAELKTIILYEKGVTLVQASRLDRDPTTQEARLNEAQEVLKQFIAENKAHALVPVATDQLGNIFVERARAKVAESERPRNVDRKAELLEQARGFYSEANGVFKGTLARIRKELSSEKYSKLNKDSPAQLIAERDALRGAYVQSQLMSATILRKKAETHKKGSASYNAGLKEASDAYGEVFKKYRTRLAGLYARLYQARCHHEMGDFKNAFAFFEELLEQPFDDEQLRKLRTKTLRMSLECLLDSPVEKGKTKNFMGSITICADWVKKVLPAEDTTPDWLGLRLQLAKAYKADADARPAGDPLKKSHLNQARRLAKYVADCPGEFKKEAKTLLASLGTGDAPTEKIDPRDFAEAKGAGREALDQVQLGKYTTIPKLEANLKRTKDGAKKAQLQEQLETARKVLAENQDNAVMYFRLALALADEETSADDQNVIRYYLCYLYFLREDFYDAAVMGEFLARHYPMGRGGRDCARIAMASYVRLHKENESDEKDFETGRTVRIAEYIAKTWSSHAVAEEALSTLIPFMIRQGRLDEAEAYLKRIDAKSPRRGDAELKTGQALWAKYLLGMKALRDADEARKKGEPVNVASLPDKEDLDDTKQRAETTLDDGVQRMRTGAVDTTMATAALSLAQIYVDTGEAEKAIELIEDSRIGPKTLVAKKHAAIEREGYSIATHKLALRAYIGALRKDADPAAANALVAKATGVMNALKKEMGNTPEGQAKLVAIYLTLANDIKVQIDNAPAETKPALRKGFDTFLTRVSEGTADIRTLTWVAQTFEGLGKTSDTGGAKLSAAAKGYYQKAVNVYNKVLELADEDADADMVLQVRMKLATTRRRLREYKKAIDLFEAVLLEKNLLLNVQIEAARTYQEWAVIGKPVLYERAMKGGRWDKEKKQYTIWGWGKIAKKTAPSRSADKFGDTFFEARYNLALCRYRFATRQETKADRVKYLQMAEADIELTARLYPTLGGAQWKAKFDALLRLIQKDLGKKVIGLKKFEEKESKKSNGD